MVINSTQTGNLLWNSTRQGDNRVLTITSVPSHMSSQHGFDGYGLSSEPDAICIAFSEKFFRAQRLVCAQLETKLYQLNPAAYRKGNEGVKELPTMIDGLSIGKWSPIVEAEARQEPLVELVGVLDVLDAQEAEGPHERQDQADA